MSIEKLPDEIINQIAAGEVIENPSGVIKELVENSIDSGADLIEIDLFNYGIKKIIIADNGGGIPKEDLLKAPLRHATSKIKTFEDLYSIKTMGFRGEALASIFSVANTKIISRTKDNEIAYEISSDNFNLIKESANKLGTTIIVENLFYNVPARKKYLKSENIELRNIIDVVMRFCLCHHNKKIVLKHDNKIIINKPKFNSGEENIIYLLGRELKENLLEIKSNFEKNVGSGINIGGFLGKPNEVNYSYLKNQYIFVNKRFIKSKLIKDAIYQGIGSNLMEGRHPMFVLFIEIDPEIIDVNIHPTKIEIKFENELQIFEMIKDTVKKTLIENLNFKEIKSGNYSGESNWNKKNKIELENLNKHIETKQNFVIDKNKDDENEIERKDEIKKDELKILNDYPKNKINNKDYFSKDLQKNFEIRENEINYSSKIANEIEINEEFMLSEKEIKIEEQYGPENKKGPLNEILNEYRIIGVVNKTYIILETKNEMMIIDFHAAQEKCYYESFLKTTLNEKKKIQNLLKSEVLKLDRSEMLTYKENLEVFENFGFETEEFGENTIIVRSVPINIRGEILNPRIVLDIIGEITLDKKFKNLEKDKLEKLASKACRRSIKAGYEMTNPEIKNLIEDLKKLDEPFNCPHGRPVILKFNWQEMEKMFKRIV